MKKADIFERLRYNVLAETLSNQQYNLLRMRLTERHFAFCGMREWAEVDYRSFQ